MGDGCSVAGSSCASAAPAAASGSNGSRDTGWGALGINTIVTFGAVLTAVVAGFLATYPGPAAPAIAAVVATAIIVPLAFFPVSKTLWSAIDLAMRPLEPDDDVDRGGSRRPTITRHRGRADRPG